MNEKASKWLLAVLLSFPVIPLLAVGLVLAGVPGLTAFFITGAAWGFAGWAAILAWVLRQPKGMGAAKYLVLCYALSAFCLLLAVALSFFGESDALDAIEIAAGAGWILFELAGVVLLLFSGKRSEPAEHIGVHP